MAAADLVLRELRTKDPRYAELKSVTSGLSGAAAATVLDNEGRALAFVKWAAEGNAYVEQQVAHEGRNLSALGPVQGVPQVLHYDPAVPLVAIEFIEVSPTATWTDDTWNAATGVLQRIRREPLTQLPSAGSLKAFNDRGGLTLRSLEASLPEHLTLAGELALNIASYSQGRRAAVHWVISLDTDELTSSEVLSIAQIARPAKVTILSTESSRQGPGTARTRALGAVHETWILTIDSDDTFNPSGVQALMDAAATQGVAWAAGQAWDVDENGTFIGFGPETPEDTQLLGKGHFFSFRSTHHRPPFHPSATVVRTEAVRRAGGWPRGWTRTEDSALWSVINSQEDGIWLPVHVLNYRKHSSSITASPSYVGNGADLLPRIEEFIRVGSTNPASYLAHGT